MNLKALAIVVVAIMLVDFVVAPDAGATLFEGFVLTLIAYAIKHELGADPYTLAGIIEKMALILWLLGSIIWNLYIAHNYVDQSAAYTAAITAWFVPAFVSAIGTGLAYVVIEEGKKLVRSF